MRRAYMYTNRMSTLSLLCVRPYMQMSKCIDAYVKLCNKHTGEMALTLHMNALSEK